MQTACHELEARLEALSQQLAEQRAATAAAEQALQASEEEAARRRESEQAAAAEAREARHQLEARSLELAHLQGERAAWVQQAKEIETREQRLYELVEATTSAPAPAPASASGSSSSSGALSGVGFESTRTGSFSRQSSSESV